MLEKPKLFLTLREFWFSILFLALLVVVRLFFLHAEYREFKEKPFYFTNVEVITAYEKWSDDRYYTIMKLYSPSLDIGFFSRTDVRVEALTTQLRLKLYPKEKMRFVEYLGSSFISSEINEIIEVPHSFKGNLLKTIASEHNSTKISNLYSAIFLATSLERDLRLEVSKLGISHLIALSGFHLAILSGVLFFLIRLLYHPFQKRYFPYRFALYDIGFMVLLLLAWYVWFVDAPPSLLRSYFMMVVGWLLLLSGMELLSIGFLVTVVMLLLVIFPKMLLSLAFWFSVLGVFYIFLFLRYFSHWNKHLITLSISFVVFVLMLPLVHLIFPIITPLQLLSPFLSLLFTLFYPISMGLHFIGQGDFFDSLLLNLFNLNGGASNYLFQPIYGVGYLLLSLLALHSKPFFYLLFLVALLFSSLLFMGFLV